MDVWWVAFQQVLCYGLLGRVPASVQQTHTRPGPAPQTLTGHGRPWRPSAQLRFGSPVFQEHAVQGNEIGLKLCLSFRGRRQRFI